LDEIEVSQINKLTTDLQQRIDKMDEIIREYERINRENEARKDELAGFDTWLEEKYNMSGHNELYEKTH